MLDILLSQRFIPEHGGTITWMFEVYRRWPDTVHVITHDYPLLLTKEVQNRLDQEKNLVIERDNILMQDWGLDSSDSLKKYAKMYRVVNRMIKWHGKVRVHCTHGVPEAACLIPLKLLYRNRLRIISYAHGEEITACASSRQLNFLYKRAIKASDIIIANSANTRRLLFESHNVKHVKIIHPGVNLISKEKIVEKRKIFREQHNIEDDAIVLLSLGRLVKRKNLDGVLRAINNLKDSTPKIVFFIAGAGPENESLKALCKKLSLENDVNFMGEVSEVEKNWLFAGCDLFISPAIQVGTDFEGFGIALLEAAAFGRPSIAGKTGGQSEAVVDGQTGVLIDGYDEHELQTALLRLILDKQLRETLGAKAFEHAQQFCWEKIAKKTFDTITTAN